MRILIMGLPGTGKTTLSEKIKFLLDQKNIPNSWYNGDQLRKQHNDWDFSPEGRLRQALRMQELSTADSQAGLISICDFVCPTPATRNQFGSADLVVWMDTLSDSRFQDTNAVFVPPTEFDLRIKTFNTAWADCIVKHICNGTKPKQWNNRAPTVQMLGRWQPWHAGHQALFERLLEKTGQVCIQIRDCQGWNDSNPFDTAAVEKNIHQALEVDYYAKYCVQVVPNIVHIGWGRGVGYTHGEETFDSSISKISATEIRKQQGLK